MLRLARDALMADARTKPGNTLWSTITSLNRGPKYGTWNTTTVIFNICFFKGLSKILTRVPVALNNKLTKKMRQYPS